MGLDNPPPILQPPVLSQEEGSIYEEIRDDIISAPEPLGPPPPPPRPDISLPLSQRPPPPLPSRPAPPPPLPARPR